MFFLLCIFELIAIPLFAQILPAAQPTLVPEVSIAVPDTDHVLAARQNRLPNGNLTIISRAGGSSSYRQVFRGPINSALFMRWYAPARVLTNATAGQWRNRYSQLMAAVRSDALFFASAGARFWPVQGRWDNQIHAAFSGISYRGWVFGGAEGRFTFHTDNSGRANLNAARTEVILAGFDNIFDQSWNAPHVPRTNLFLNFVVLGWERDVAIGLLHAYQLRTPEVGANVSIGNPTGVVFGFGGHFSGPGVLGQQVSLVPQSTGFSGPLPPDLRFIYFQTRAGLNVVIPTGAPVVFRGDVGAEYRSSGTWGGGNITIDHLAAITARISADLLFLRERSVRVSIFGGAQYRIFWYGENPSDLRLPLIRSSQAAPSVELGGMVSY